MRTLLKGAVAGLVTLGVSAAVAGVAFAGPPRPPSFGVMEPAGIGDACPWPDAANWFMENIEGVQKCLPQEIPWSEEIGPFGPSAGVRIVTDSLVAATGASGSGQVTFWCQSRVGFHYLVTVQGLTPYTTYPVTAHMVGSSTTLDLGTLRTDAQGNGLVAGVVGLPTGGYDLHVFVGSTLIPDPGDPDIGFSVL